MLKYNVIEGLTVKDIMGFEPCSVACKALLKEFVALDYMPDVITQDYFNNSKVLQENVGWLLAHELVEPAFKPVSVAFEFRTEDEFRHVWHMLNSTVSDLEDNTGVGYVPFRVEDATIARYWGLMDKVATECNINI